MPLSDLGNMDLFVQPILLATDTPNYKYLSTRIKLAIYADTDKSGEKLYIFFVYDHYQGHTSAINSSVGQWIACLPSSHVARVQIPGQPDQFMYAP